MPLRRLAQQVLADPSDEIRGDLARGLAVGVLELFTELAARRLAHDKDGVALAKLVDKVEKLLAKLDSVLCQVCDGEGCSACGSGKHPEVQEILRYYQENLL